MNEMIEPAGLDANQPDSAQVAALASSQVHPSMALPHRRAAASQAAPGVGAGPFAYIALDDLDALAKSERAKTIREGDYLRVYLKPFTSIDRPTRPVYLAALPAPAQPAGAADDLAAKFNAAVDAEYPLPDNPHASVILRVTEGRAAMWRGINAARKILPPVVRADVPAEAKLADLANKVSSDLYAEFGYDVSGYDLVHPKFYERFAQALLDASPSPSAPQGQVAPIKPALMRQAVASVVSRVGNELRVGWLRPERCDVGTLLYCASEPVAGEAPADAWTPADQLPDADITVMLAMTDGEVWQGYWNGADWIEVSGLTVTGRVSHWQHTPKHPEDKS